MSPAEDITPKGFRTVIRLNVEGTWLMTHAVATQGDDAGRRRGGKILNVTLSPHHGLPGMAHSSAARAAVENLTRVLSIEWARFGIRLVALAAGQFATETLRTKYPQQVVEGWPARSAGAARHRGGVRVARGLPGLAGGRLRLRRVLTIDGARDNWFGAWPPAGLTGEGGKPLAEERRPKQ